MFDRKGRVNNCEVVSVTCKGLQGFENARFTAFLHFGM